MKKRLNILSNDNIKNFLNIFFCEYKLTFIDLESIDYKNHSTQKNIIVLNSNEIDSIDFSSLNENFLIMSNFKNKKINLNKNVTLLDTPMSIHRIKNTVENFLQNLKIHFKDLFIENEKLTNLNNKSFCYLTKIESEILSFLVTEKEVSKNYIKENILNIKSDIQTNSLDSHLTRIRKKMNKLNTIVKIQTKSEKLIINI